MIPWTLTLSIVCCLVFSGLADGATKKAATAGAQKGQTCASCHKEGAGVLPKGHKPVTVTGINNCNPCHKPDFTGKAEPRSYAALLHRPHVKSGASVLCSLCHTWTPGKAFGVKGVKGSFGAPSKEDMPLLERAFTSWASSPYLDGKHGKANIVCLACHGNKVPEQGDTVENDRCLSCHGTVEALAARSAPKDFPDRNPHKSHLGDIACTVCHHGHKASTVYCLGCHPKFSMKIPAAN